MACMLSNFQIFKQAKTGQILKQTEAKTKRNETTITAKQEREKQSFGETTIFQLLPALAETSTFHIVISGEVN